MKLIGRIKDIGRTLDGKFTITLESPDMDTNEATDLSQSDKLDVEIRKHRYKRDRKSVV